MAGHAQLKFVMTECSKTQIRLTGPILSISPNKFNKFHNTGAQMHDSVYHNYDTKIAFNSQMSHQNVKISPLEKATF